MALEKALQDFIAASGKESALHLRLTGSDDAQVMEQAQLYAEALVKAGRAAGHSPVVLDFDKADNTDTVDQAFTAAKDGVIIIHGLHAPSTTSSGAQQLRAMLSMAWDLKQSTMVFAGEDEAVSDYFRPLAEMQTRTPFALRLLTQAEKDAVAQAQRRAEWQEMKDDYIYTAHDIDAPPAASFKKQDMKV